MIRTKIFNALHKTENVAAFLILVFLALFPTMEIIARKVFSTGVPGSTGYIQHLVLWITFVGGMITSREGQHLSLAVGIDNLPEKIRSRVRLITSVIALSITWAFAVVSLSMVFYGFDSTKMVGIFPIRYVIIIMPIGFAVMAVRFVTVQEISWKLKTVLVAVGIFMGTLFSMSSVVNFISTFTADVPAVLTAVMEFSNTVTTALSLVIIIVLVISGVFGTPIFIVLGGIAYMLFVRSAGSLEVISNEAYVMLIGNLIPTIPLFTFAGFILSESKAGERLVNLFKAWLGWMPGGIVVAAVVVCAFFTTFTGASGVTILALGGLLSYVLIQSKFTEDFTDGLLTASGSIGLLFPPSLPIILYGVVAQINIKKMFVGGIVPGIVMVVILSLYGVFFAVRNKTERIPFKAREALRALRESIWEILLPVIILLGYFGGLTTIVETGAIAVIYSLIVVVLIHRDIRVRDLPTVMLKSVPIIGGILVILALARGLSYFIVDAEIPMNLSLWVQTHIGSKILFLVFLNIALLITGCLMDIFSAIMVVVPLIIPLGKIFGIDPVHLGIIFLANLELGYLTPPVGLNLFLASYRFEKPLSTIYRNVIPFFLVLLVTVILITYVPVISTGLVSLFFTQ